MICVRSKFLTFLLFFSLDLLLQIKMSAEFRHVADDHLVDGQSGQHRSSASDGISLRRR